MCLTILDFQTRRFFAHGEMSLNLSFGIFDDCGIEFFTLLEFGRIESLEFAAFGGGFGCFRRVEEVYEARDRADKGVGEG